MLQGEEWGGEKARRGVAKGGNATRDGKRSGARVCITSEDWSQFTGEELVRTGPHHFHL